MGLVGTLWGPLLKCVPLAKVVWSENRDGHISDLPHYHWSCSAQLVYVSPAGSKCEVRFQKRGISDHIY